MNFIRNLFNALSDLLKDDIDLRSEDYMISSPFSIDGLLSKFPIIFTWTVYSMIIVGCLCLFVIIVEIVSFVF